MWRAKRDGQGELALKILRELRSDAERYRRFMNEVAFYRSLGGRSGILPVIDSDLPERPSRAQPAWLAMPIATPLRDHLGEDPDLEEIVRSIAAVAGALAEVAQGGGAHRDVKPNNMYRYDNAYVIGDFGLVQLPGRRGLTLPGKRLGPIHFHAPEMLSAPTAADGRPADVYSLAKSLWVLATGQTFPLPGELRVDVAAFRLGSYVRHPRASLLERLIERSTTHEPGKRPTMAEVKAELEAWLSLNSDHPVPDPSDLSDLAKRWAAASAPAQAVADQRERWTEEAQETFGRLQTAIREARTPLAVMAQRPFQNVHTRPGRLHLASQVFNEPERIWDGVDCRALSSPEMNGIIHHLYVGAQVELFDDGCTRIVVGYWLDEQIGPSIVDHDEVWSLDTRVPLGSAQLEEAIRMVELGLPDNRRQALGRFVERLETTQ